MSSEHKIFHSESQKFSDVPAAGQGSQVIQHQDFPIQHTISAAESFGICAVAFLREFRKFIESVITYDGHEIRLQAIQFVTSSSSGD
jgi:hypothetical protein